MSSRMHRWHSCRIKKFHNNFWTAIQHCMALKKESPEAPVFVYKCDFCEGMHVSSGLNTKKKNTNKVRHALNKNLNMMRHINFWLDSDPKVVAYIITYEIKLLKHLLGIEYLVCSEQIYIEEEYDETSLSDWND